MNSLKWIGVSFVFFIAFIITAVNLKWNLGYFAYVNYIPFGDKICHFFLIGTLTYFVNILFDRRRVDLFVKPVLLGSLCVFTFISFEEASQFFLAHRNCEILDLVANYLGIYIFGFYPATKSSVVV